MKKLLAIILTLAILFSFSSCGTDKNSDEAKNVYAEGGVTISTDAFPEDTELKVETIKTDDTKYQVAKTVLPKAVKIDAYEITAQSKGVEVQPDGSVKVTFPIPENYDGSKHDVEVYYISDDGVAEKISAKLEKSGVVAQLQHFSTYVVILVEKSNDITSSDATSSDAASSDATSSNSTPPAENVGSSNSSSTQPPKEENQNTSSKVETVTAPKLSGTKVEEMTQQFLWASKFAYNVNGRRYTDFYGKNLKDLTPLTVLTFLYRYCDDEFDQYEKEEEYTYITSVPKTVLDKLAKKHLGYTYNFTKSYTHDDYYILIEYDSKSDKVVFTEDAGGFGDPDGFKYQGYKQNGDTVTVDLVYHSYTEEKPQGVEGKDWIDVSEDDYICYVEISDPSILTFKYVDGAWRIISFKAK